MTMTDATLAELAVRLPAASRVFRRHGLDYCCGGKRPLADACRARDLDPETVLAEVERESALALAAVPSFEGRSQGEIIDHILERYHDPLRAELPELVAMAKRVEMRHGDKPECPRGLAAHLDQMHAELLSHLSKEEGILFPLLRSGGGMMSPQGPITVMRHEHDDHAASLRRTRELAHDLVPPAVACNTWRALYLRLAQLEADLMDHIHVENNVLFPRALAD